MLTSIQGIYRKGKIELTRKPKNISDDTSVIVTFLDSGSVDLRKRGISKHKQRLFALNSRPSQRTGTALK